YSTCSGASVLYTLIAAPPAWTMPRSAITCSGALRAMINPNCPGPKPSERSASVTAATWSRYSRQVSVSQLPSCFQWRAGRSPHLPTASANRVQIVWPETAASMPARSASTSITRNTLIQGGGESLIYVRSHRSVMTRGIAALAWMAAFAGLAVEAFRLPQGAVAGVALALGSAGGAGLAAPGGLQPLGRAPGPVVPLPRPNPGHPGPARDARGLDGDGRGNAVRARLVAERQGDRPAHDPAA